MTARGRHSTTLSQDTAFCASPAHRLSTCYNGRFEVRRLDRPPIHFPKPTPSAAYCDSYPSLTCQLWTSHELPVESCLSNFGIFRSDPMLTQTVRPVPTLQPNKQTWTSCQVPFEFYYLRITTYVLINAVSLILVSVHINSPLYIPTGKFWGLPSPTP